MSYTGCRFAGKLAQVDGTSYAFAMAIAMEEAARLAKDEQRQQLWLRRLESFRVRLDTCTNDIIGVTFSELVEDDRDQEEIVRGLRAALRRIESFRGRVPADYLKNVIHHRGYVHYLQQDDEDPSPYVLTIRTLLKLLAGIESY